VLFLLLLLLLLLLGNVLLCVASEHDGQQTERHEDCSLPATARAESGCPATKAIEVCVNGVKQVIIIPLAQSSDVVDVVSSSTSPLWSSSSVIGTVPLDGVPDDVKLLAESCIEVTSSAVSSFSQPAVFSADTNDQSRLSAGFMNHSVQPAPYQSCTTFAGLPVEVPQTQYAAAHPQFHINSLLPTSNIPQPSPSLPAPAAINLPRCGFPPAQQSVSTTPLPPSLQQLFRLPAYRNSVLPHLMQSDSNQWRHVLPGMVSEAPWTSYNPLQMRPTYVRNSTTMDTAVSNSLPLGPTLAARQAAPYLPLPRYPAARYQHFLPSLQSAISPVVPVRQPPVQFQDYLLRKRGVLPQNAQRGFPVDAGIYRTPQFDPHPLAGSSTMFPRAPAVNAGELPTSLANTSSVSASSSLSHLYSKFGTSAGNNGGRKHRTVHTSHKDNTAHPMSSASQRSVSFELPVVRCEASQLLNGGISRHITPVMCPTTAFRTALMIADQRACLQNGISTTCPTDMQGSVSKTQPITLTVTAVETTPYVTKTANLCMLPQNSTSVLFGQPKVGIPSNLQGTINRTQPRSVAVTVIAASSVATVTTYVTESTFRPTTGVQVTAATKSNVTLDTLPFDVGCNPSATSVPSNCSLTSNPSLSNLSLTDLFTPSSVTVADSAHTASALDPDRPAGTDLEIGTSQLGDSCNDLGSLPADVMAETAESESLLMSFCDLFEQSNAADGVQDSLENGEQRKDGSVAVNHAVAESGLQFAKSLGKGRHFTDEIRQRRREQASRKRRRNRLTSLEFVEDSNSSDSWHPESNASDSWNPDSQSEFSDNNTPSPAPSTESSRSRESESDDFAFLGRQSKRRRTTYGMQKQSLREDRVKCSAVGRQTRAVDDSRPAATQDCSVMLERLELRGQQSVNVHLIQNFICCPERRCVKPVQRILSSDSECSTDDRKPIKKLRIKILRVQEDPDSS